MRGSKLAPINHTGIRIRPEGKGRTELTVGFCLLDIMVNEK